MTVAQPFPIGRGIPGEQQAPTVGRGFEPTVTRATTLFKIVESLTGGHRDSIVGVSAK